MKWIMLIIILQLVNNCFCQDIPEQQVEEQLQSLSEAGGDDIDDDDLMEKLDKLQRHPLNLNEANEQELLQLPFVSPVLVKNLISYRHILGKLIHINELQAVPGWNTDLIRKILPYVSVDMNDFNFTGFGKAFQHLQSSFLFRIAQAFQKNNDPGSPSNQFLGSPQHMLAKFQFHSGTQLQFGGLIEKDAGEKWFLHGGFDFNSFYFFARTRGLIKKIAIGDFQVNMGQGLVQWQSIARKKSGNVVFINQQDESLRPYHSAGEIRFHRGAAITLARNHFEWMIYGSSRKLCANFITDSFQNTMVTSISNSGYHRTLSELNDRNKLHQLSAGSTLTYSNSRARISVNYVAFWFSHPIQKKDEPYNLFSFHGKQMHNVSFNYSYTLQNVHCFGEFAVDEEMHKAVIAGALLSLTRNLDCSLLFRSISPKYYSFYSNAFTENSLPANETGWYAGLSLHMSASLRMDGYFDVFYFPWLKYTVDAPSMGKELFLQLNWQPSKKLQAQARWKLENKESDDDAVNNNIVQQVDGIQKISWRSQVNWMPNKKISLSERVETSSVKMLGNSASGFLLFSDINFHPPMKPFDCWGRVLFFQVDSYDARIYAFERDVQYGFSVPAYAGMGVHYAFNFHYDLSRVLNSRVKRTVGIWVSVSQTIPGFDAGTSGIQKEANGKTQSSIRFQLLLGS